MQTKRLPRVYTRTNPDGTTVRVMRVTRAEARAARMLVERERRGEGKASAAAHAIAARFPAA